MTAPAADARTTDTDDPCTTHWFCCDSDTALCGADLTDVDDDTPPASCVSCVVCNDLVNQPCPRCGFDPGAGRG